MPDPTRKLLDAVEDLLAAADEETDINHLGTTEATISSVWIEPVREAYRAARNAWRERRKEG